MTARDFSCSHDEVGRAFERWASFTPIAIVLSFSSHKCRGRDALLRAIYAPRTPKRWPVAEGAAVTADYGEFPARLASILILISASAMQYDYAAASGEIYTFRVIAIIDARRIAMHITMKRFI